MKKIIAVIMVMAISSIQFMYGQNTVVDTVNKQSYSSDKEMQIKKAARKVCDEVAPKYGVENLVPVIYDFPVGDNHPIINRKAIAVKYMRNVNDYTERKVSALNPDKKKSEKITIKRAPKFVIEVVMFEDTLEPLFIMDENNRSKSFQPSYSEFKKQHPNETLEPLATPM